MSSLTLSVAVAVKAPTVGLFEKNEMKFFIPR